MLGLVEEKAEDALLCSLAISWGKALALACLTSGFLDSVEWGGARGHTFSGWEPRNSLSMDFLPGLLFLTFAIG